MLSVGSVFSGIGLLDYGLHLAGLHHAWLCERDPWRRSILARRFPGARVADDVRHVGHGFEHVHVIAGGFPCKGASSAGPRNGFEHPETVLWHEMARAVRELRPRYVLVENVANILGLHDGAVWGTVVGDLAAFGYDVVWDCLPAAAVGAPHLRDRVFAVASHAAELGHERTGPAWDGRSGSADGGLGDAIAPDAEGARGQGAWPGREALGGTAPGRGIAAAPADAGCKRGELCRGPAAVEGSSGEAEGEAPQRQRPRDAAGDRRQATAHAARDAEGGPGPSAGAERQRARTRAVDWGEYEPAIGRWERVHGTAPAPLVERVRGVDARHAARVERSRLSALGDGVQVQVGRIAGEYIMDLERGRVAA